MKLSVIVTAHNEEEYVGQCIDSVLSQTHPDVELILVCDSCTDGTADVARGRGISPLEVNYSSTGLARNAGLERVTGEYFTCMDADDYYCTPDSLRILDDRLSRDPVDVLSFGAFFGSRLASCYYAPGTPWPNVAFNLFRTSRYQGHQFPDSSHCEDQAWFKENVASGDTISFIDTPIYQYRYPQAESAIGRHHQGNVKSLISQRRDLAQAISQIRKIPIKFDRGNWGGIEFLMREAASQSYLLPPTLVLLTEHPATPADTHALSDIENRIRMESKSGFDINVMWMCDSADRNDVWGVAGRFRSLTSGSANLLSLKILHVFGDINRRELETTSRDVVETTAVEGLPRSHAEAFLQVVAELCASTKSPA